MATKKQTSKVSKKTAEPVVTDELVDAEVVEDSNGEAEQLDAVSADDSVESEEIVLSSTAQEQDVAPDEPISEPISEPIAEQTAPDRAFLGPFSLREFLLGVLGLLILIFSFFPVAPGVSEATIWTSGIQFVLTVLFPVAAIILVLVRRFAPTKIVRIGSLGIDQLLSVSFVVAFISWLALVLSLHEIWSFIWPFWVELFLMVCGLALSVAAPIIPGLRDDFRARTLLLARPQSRTVRVLEPRTFKWLTPPADYLRSADDYTASKVVVDVVPEETIPGSEVLVSDGTEALSVLWVRAERDVILFDAELNECGILSAGSWALALEESDLGLLIRLQSGAVVLVKETDALFWHDREPLQEQEALEGAESDEASDSDER